MLKAWVINNTIRDVSRSGPPEECYHPDIAALYTVDVPDDVENGASLQGDGSWKVIIPEPPAATVAPHEPAPVATGTGGAPNVIG